jgi:hypothetical protein
MSERVTWHACPRCGALAAAGWVSVAGGDAAPAEDHAVEFDCTAGCGISLEMAQAHLHPRRGPVPSG